VTIPKLPSIPKLTGNGTRDAMWVLGVIGVLLVVFSAGRCAGEKSATDKVDVRAESALRDSLAKLTKQLPALLKTAATVDSLTRLTRAPHDASKAATDTAAAHELSARTALEAALRDSLAQVADVRAKAQALIVSDSIAYAAVVAERDAANARIMALVNEHAADSTLLAKDAQTIAVSAEELAARAKVEADLKSAQPGVAARAVHGITAAGAGAACAGLGSLASPLVALGAGVLCAAVVGVIVH